MVNVLLIGAGGREHALALALRRSKGLTKLFVAPGNPGIAALAECVTLDTANPQAVLQFCRLMGVSFVVIGPETPLVAGLVDNLEKGGIKAFGPSKAAAQLEGSKEFTKQLCDENKIPTAQWRSFDDGASAIAYVQTCMLPIVIKADGLAAGKGVMIAAQLDDAKKAISTCFETAGGKVVIEEYLDGEEVSFFVLCDGENVVALTSAQDHKRAFDGDQGPNTGGMGAYSPAPVFTGDIERDVMTRIILPTVAAMKKRGMPFKGVLFAGLMLTKSGPQLIEYNCRFGDPETQVILPRLRSDLLDLLQSCANGTLAQKTAVFGDDAALTIVYAAKGYPGAYEKGSAITLPAPLLENDQLIITHAGTAMKGTQLVADGGRVLNITAVAPQLQQAHDLAYAAIGKMEWPQGFYRQDIGWRALKSVSTPDAEKIAQ